MKKYLKGILSFVFALIVTLSMNSPVSAWSDSSPFAAPMNAEIEFYVDNQKQTNIELNVGEATTVEARISFDLSTPGSTGVYTMPNYIKIESDNENLTITPIENEVPYEFENTGVDQIGVITQSFTITANSELSDATVTLFVDLNNENIYYGSGNDDGFESATLTLSAVNNSNNEEESVSEESNNKTETATNSYEVLNGANQKYDATLSDRLTFRFDIPYLEFLASGNVYMDGLLVNPSNYEVKEGSTIIIFGKAYTNKLKAGNHTMKLKTANGETSVNFTVTKAVNNPETGDNILVYMLMLGLGLIGLVIKRIYEKNKLFN